MARRARRVAVDVVDDGSFKRFIRNAPKEVRRGVIAAIAGTAAGVRSKVSSRAPVGPFAPHIQDDVEVRSSKDTAYTLWAKVGYLSKKPAGGTDPDATQPSVAFWQEYGTDHSGSTHFMFRSAEEETDDYRKRVISALKDAERRLAI
jgi:hypothetical protein